MIFSIIFTRTSKAENSLFSRNIVKFTIFGRYKNLTSTSLKKTWFYPACRVHNILLSYRQTSFKNIRQESVWWWVCEVAGTINVGHVIYRPVVPSCFNNQITMNLLNPSVVPHLCSFTRSFFKSKKSPYDPGWNSSVLSVLPRFSSLLVWVEPLRQCLPELGHQLRRASEVCFDGIYLGSFQGEHLKFWVQIHQKFI